MLGPLEADVEGRPVGLGDRRPRALLAVLALNAGSTVSTERLIDALWGDRPPASAPKMIQLYVSQLRRALAEAGDGEAILTRPHGYELRLEASDVDVLRFEQLVARGAPRDALALWRGPPLDDVAGEPFAAGEIRRIEKLRLHAAELAIDQDLAAGRHRAVIPELEALLAREPLRESLYARLMLALYRAGRQADALAAYRRARATLVDEVGVEPGPELRGLHEQILSQDASLLADRAAMDRTALRAAEAELADGVAELQAARTPAAPVDAAPVACPFKGLAPFGPGDADVFFGRERLVAEMVARLAGAPLMGIAGPSGSGKSSALRAGLLPALAAGVLPGSDGWAQAPLRPGEHPARALQRALAQVPAGRRVVIAVDQFEETFTACADETERVAFVEALVAHACDPSGRFVVLLAVRADFYGRCAAYPDLSRLLGAGHVLVGPMRRDELRRAIELPARGAGLEAEPDLVDALVADVEGRAGALPLLSTSLLELWQQRDGRRLTLAAYRQAGGVNGAVARLAEGAYAALDDDGKRLARAILLRLAGDGDGDAAVRARVALDEFDDDAARVLGELADRRLVTVSDGEAEVAHEALLREWPRLRGWLEEDAHGRRLHRHLRAAAREWTSGARDPTELYRGARLASALDWAAAHEHELAPAEREFLTGSRRLAERSQRRLRGALAGAVALLVLAVVAGVVALDQRGNARDQATVADAQRLGARALVENNLDRSLLLARQGVALADWAQTRGSLLAALLRSPAAIGVVPGDGERTWTTDLSPDGRMLAVGKHHGDVILYDTRTRRPVRTIRPTPDGTPISNLAFSADGSRLAVGHDTPARGNLVAVVDPGSGRVLRRLALPPYRLVTGLRWHDAATLDVVASGWPGQPPIPALLLRFDVPTGRRLLGPLQADRSGISPLLASGDGRRVVTVGIGETLLRDPGTLAVVRRLPVGADPASYPGHPDALSADGRTLAIGDARGSIRLIELDSGRVHRLPGGHVAPVSGAVFSPDGRTLVTTGNDGRVLVWNVGSRTLTETLTGPAGTVFSPKLADGGATLHTASSDGTLYTWDLGGHRRLSRRFVAGAGDVDLPRSAISADGRLMAVGQSDGAVSVVDLRTLSRRAFPVVPRDVPAGERDFGTVLGMGFVPGSHLLAVGGHRGFLVLVDADTGRSVRRLQGHSGMLWTPAFTADGSVMLTGSDDRTVRFWSLPSGDPLGRPLRFRTVVGDAQISPDGRQATVSVLDANNLGGRLEVYDVRTRRLVRRIRRHEGIEFVRFSRDGRRALIGTDRAQAEVWSTEDWRPVTRRFGPHPSGVIGGSFSPDGRTLATGAGDGTVRLWDLAGQQEIGAPLSGEPERPAIPYFTPDGRALIVSQSSGVAHRWDIRASTLIRQACRVAGRRLTRAEWQEFLPGRAYDPAC